MTGARTSWFRVACELLLVANVTLVVYNVAWGDPTTALAALGSGLAVAGFYVGDRERTRVRRLQVRVRRLEERLREYE